MNMTSKIFIVSALVCVSTAAAFSQDCNNYLRRATELVSQKKYCDAIGYYQMYGRCNADADISTEIAMCERRCKIEAMDDGDDTPVVTPNQNNRSSTVRTTDSRNSSSSSTPASSRPVKQPKDRTQGFSGFQLHAGVFLPVGTFAYDKLGRGFVVGSPETGQGNAALGFNLGFKVYNSISSVKGLTWLFGADAFYNGMHREYKDIIADLMDKRDSYRIPFYLNAPFTVGINYAYSINKTFCIYGEMAGGFNLSKYIGLKYGYTFLELECSVMDKWKMGAGFTYGLETGVMLKEKINIGLGYRNLGAYKYKGKAVTKIGEESTEVEIKFLKRLPISGITFNVGFFF